MRGALLWAATGCLVAQVAMVEAGHALPAWRDPGFAIGGMAISLLAGLWLGRAARAGRLATVGGGALAGGLGAFAGIALSAWHGDVRTSLLAMGTVASTVAGVIGAAVGRMFARPAPGAKPGLGQSSG